MKQPRFLKSTYSLLEYNPPMSLPGDGSSPSARSLDIRLVVDRIPAFTWSAHADGSAEFVNQRWREYAGLSPEESQGWGWQVASHPEDLPSLIRKWRDLLISGEPGEIEARMCRHDGTFLGSSFASNSGDVFQKENTLFGVLFRGHRCE
jgi:PAS domain-containing protein